MLYTSMYITRVGYMRMTISLTVNAYTGKCSPVFEYSATKSVQNRLWILFIITFLSAQYNYM